MIPALAREQITSLPGSPTTSGRTLSPLASRASRPPTRFGLGAFSRVGGARRHADHARLGPDPRGGLVQPLLRDRAGCRRTTTDPCPAAPSCFLDEPARGQRPHQERHHLLFRGPSVPGRDRGRDSPEVSATPKAPACVSPAGGGCSRHAPARSGCRLPRGHHPRRAGTYTECAKIIARLYLQLLRGQSVTLEGGWDFHIHGPQSRGPPHGAAPVDPGLLGAHGAGSIRQLGRCGARDRRFHNLGRAGDLGPNHGGGVRMRRRRRNRAQLRGYRKCFLYFLGGGIWVQRGAPRLEGNRIRTTA